MSLEELPLLSMWALCSLVAVALLWSIFSLLGIEREVSLDCVLVGPSRNKKEVDTIRSALAIRPEQVLSIYPLLSIPKTWSGRILHLDGTKTGV
jgi:hypothetical protein